MKSALLSFVPKTRFVLNGQTVEVESLDIKNGTAVLKSPPPRRESLCVPLKDLHAMYFSGELTLPPAALAQYKPTWKATLQALKPDQRRRVDRRIAYTNACVGLYPVGPNSKRLSAAIADVAERNRDSRPPSPHSVYRWMRRYILSNYDTGVFVQDAGAVRTRQPKLEKGVRDLLKAEIERLLGASEGATLHGVMDEALALVAKQLGHLKFVAKDGTEHCPDEFLTLVEQRRAQAAAAKAAKERAQHEAE
jgi:putative transposase